jgi:hypothetical protein
VSIGLLWLFFWNHLLQLNQQNNICNDCDNYREAASLLYHHGKAHYFRPIGMALIAGLPYLFGANDAAIYSFSLIVNMLAWLGTALFLFYFLKKRVSSKRALVASLLFYSVLSGVFNQFQLLTEPIFTFLMATVFYCLDQFDRKNEFHWLSLAISVLIYAALVKPSVKFLALFALIYFGKIMLKNYRAKSAVFIYVSMLLVVFQCVKMKIAYGNFTLTYVDGVTYYNYLGSKAFYYKQNNSLSQDTNKRAVCLAQKSYPDQQKIAAQDFINQLKTNKLNLLRAYISDLSENTKTPHSGIAEFKNIQNRPYFNTLQKAVSIVSKYQNRFFTLAGFLLALYFLFKRQKIDRVLRLLGLYILYTIFISGVACAQGDRFHLVFFPFVIVLMVQGYANFTAAKKWKRAV